MGITFRKRDFNRYRKVYGTYRRPEQFGLTAAVGQNFVIEVAEVKFINQHTANFKFTEAFRTIPVVTVVATSGDVNVFLTEVSQQTVTVESSGDFTGSVFLHAIEIGS
jgi:hypothetical protein